MAINASAGNSAPRQLPPSGTHIARCYQIIDLGTHEKEWQGQKKRKREIRVSWELPLETADFGKGKEEPFAVHKTYTLSLHEKAVLRHDLENWRGRPFRDAELELFDVAKVIGHPCMVTITHVDKGGNTYASVTAVTSLAKGMTAPPQVNPSVEYSIDNHDAAIYAALPQFLRDMIASSEEWQAPDESPTDDQRIATEQDDDIPF